MHGYAETVLLDLPRSCPGLLAARPGVKLEHPQPRSGEDERNGRGNRRKIIDGGGGSVAAGWSDVACVFPVLAGGDAILPQLP